MPGRVLAYLIAGHHAGLYDWNSEFSSLEARLAASAPDLLGNHLPAHSRPVPPEGSLGEAPQAHMMTPDIDHEALPMEINAAEFKAKCLKLLDEVATTHEPLVITKRGRPVARLVPIEDDTAESRFGYLRGTVSVLGDLIEAHHEPLAAETGDEDALYRAQIPRRKPAR